jgi:AbrB family looped-hinge helix DNA binding protein
VRLQLVEKREAVHIYGTVKVGEKGQVVIPSDARKDFKIKPGDLLLVITGRNRRGLTMVKADAMKDFATRILQSFDQT